MKWLFVGKLLSAWIINDFDSRGACERHATEFRDPTALVIVNCQPWSDYRVQGDGGSFGGSPNLKWIKPQKSLCNEPNVECGE
jgi:hypothetical protein